MCQIFHFFATNIRLKSAVLLKVLIGSRMQMLALASGRDGALTSGAVSASVRDVCSWSHRDCLGLFTSSLNEVLEFSGLQQIASV